MQYVFFALGFTGLGILFFGVKWTILAIRNETVGEFDLNEKPTEIIFQKPGLYSVNFIGGLRVNNNKDFFVRISKDEKRIGIYELKVNYKFHYHGKPAVEFCAFEIINIGKYYIEFKNTEDLEVKTSPLIISGMFQNKLGNGIIRVLIKETQWPINRILAIIFTILGLQCALAGFILGFNPQVYN